MVTISGGWDGKVDGCGDNSANMDRDIFVLLPDQTYQSIAHDRLEDQDDDCSDSDSNNDSEEYLKEMEMILRKIRRKRKKIAG